MGGRKRKEGQEGERGRERESKYRTRVTVQELGCLPRMQQSRFNPWHPYDPLSLQGVIPKCSCGSKHYNPQTKTRSKTHTNAEVLAR